MCKSLSIFNLLAGKVLLPLFCLMIIISAAARASEPVVRIAVLGDRYSGEDKGVFGEIVREIDLLQPDLVLHVGDIIDSWGDSLEIIGQWNGLDSLIAPLDVPLYGPPGNNDIWDNISEKIYVARYGSAYGSTDFDGIHIVMLDNSRWENEDFPIEQLAWLRADLEKNQSARYIIVLMHKPFWYAALGEGKSDPFHDIFVKHGVDAVFTGHYHEYFSGTYDGIKYTGVGSSGGGTDTSPNGLKYHFLWVTVDDKDINIATIKKDAVLPWDNITAAERIVFRPLRQTGLTFVNQAVVAEDMTIPETRIGLRINNAVNPAAINDTLHWDIPEGWSVKPAVMPLTVAPRAIDTVYFTVAGSGPLFPVPSVSADLDYAANKKVAVAKNLGTTRMAICNPVEKKIKIDGDLSEKCWQNAETRFFAPDGGQPAAEPVEFYFAYDKNNLYLAAKCSESMMDSLRAKAAAHDYPVHRDDCVGYFIAPDYALDTFYQIYFNPAGVAYDVKYWMNNDGYLDGSLEWNGQYEVKSAKNADSWTIEIKMPLKQFGVQLEQGKKMHVNFRRKQPRLGNADWITPIEYDPNYYGQLIMR